MKRNYLVLAFCLFILQAYSQSNWMNISDTRKPFKIIADGNLMWFCSRGGLMCINQQTQDTTFFNHANSGMPFTRVIDMCLDLQGRLWLVCDSEGIACKDGDVWTWYHKDNTPLPGNQAVSVTVDSQGNLWFGVDRNLVKYDGVTWTTISLEPIGNTLFLPYHIAIDKDDRVLIPVDGIWAYDGNDFVNYNSSNTPLPDNYINTIKTFPDGKVWIAHSLSKLTITDFTTWEVYDSLVPGKPLTYVTSFDKTPRGDYWLSTLGGDIYFRNSSGWSLVSVPSPVGPLNQVGYIACDGVGSLYLSATESAVYNGSDWLTLNVAESGFRGHQVSDIVHSTDGSSWTCGMYGVQHFSGNEWVNYLVDDIGYLNPSCMAEDESGKLAAGLQHSLSIFNQDGEWHRIQLPDDPYFHGYTVSGLYYDSKDQLWIAEWPGIIRANATDTVFLSSWYGNFPVTSVSCIAENPSGSIMMGSSEGFIMQDNTNWLLFDTSNSPLPSNKVESIDTYEDIVWIGTKEGLAKLVSGNWTIYTPGNSPLPDAEISCLDVDPQGVVWMISGFDNLVRFDGLNWQVFDYGISGMNNSIMRSIEVDVNQNIWIGGIGCGLTLYNENGILLGTNEFPVIQTLNNVFLSVVPNPCKQVIRIQYQVPVSEIPCLLTLSDMKGKILSDEVIKETEGILIEDIYSLSPGLYCLTITGRHGRNIISSVVSVVN